MTVLSRKLSWKNWILFFEQKYLIVKYSCKNYDKLHII